MNMTINQKVRTLFSGLGMASLLALSATAAAAPIKTYQVTGPVLEVTDTTITVEKENERWQLARDKETKVDGELKPGARVTIHYRMSATAIEVKSDPKADGKADKKVQIKTGGPGESRGDSKNEANKPAKDKPAKQ